MRLDVQNWEGSAVVRLPAAALEAAGIPVGQGLELRVESGRLVIEPAAASRHDLHDLLALVTPANRHECHDLLDLRMDGTAAGIEPW